MRAERSYQKALTGAAALAVAVSVAGCGGSKAPVKDSSAGGASSPATTAPAASATTAPATTAPAASTSTAAPATTAPPAAPSGPQACTTAQLALALTNPQGTAGSTYVTLTFRNTGAAACSLSGYPGVSYVSGDSGTQVGAAAQRDPSTPVSSVTVGPGSTAHARVRLIDPYVFNPSQCQITAVRGLRVYPPGQTAAAFVPDAGKACSNPNLPQPALFVGAVAPGAS